MMRRWHVPLTLILVCGIPLGLLNCNNGDYLYYSKPSSSKSYQGTHQLKELGEASVVDIIWIIDNSGSMSTHQQDVIANTDRFIQNFTQGKQIDWKMGLISTDDGPDGVRKDYGFKPGEEMTNHSPDVVPRFQDAVRRLGTNGSSTEKTFTPLENIIHDYPSFLRPSAGLVFIVVTDAPEQSEGISGSDFMKWLVSKKLGHSELIQGYGIFAADDIPNCKGNDDPWNYVGSSYEYVIKKTKGIQYTLCAPDFGDQLAQMGKRIVSYLIKPRILLQARPVASSIQVFYHGKELPGGPMEEGGMWNYDFAMNAIVFYNLDFAPGEDESVEVRYREDSGDR